MNLSWTVTVQGLQHTVILPPNSYESGFRAFAVAYIPLLGAVEKGQAYALTMEGMLFNKRS